MFLFFLAVSFLFAAGPDAGAARLEAGVRVEIEADTIRVGDRVRVSYVVSHPESVEFLPIEGVRDLGTVYLLPAEKRAGGTAGDSLAVDTIGAWVVPFRTGSVTVPRLELFFQTPGGLRGTALTDSLVLEVRSVLPPDAGDIKPLKPNIRAPGDFGSYILLGLLACALAAASFLAFRLVRRRKRPEPKRIPPPARPAEETALEELMRIESLGLLVKGMFKEYYSLVSMALRIYIGAKFGFETADLTTWEVIREMRMLAVDEKFTRESRLFLERCDLVKFAKLVPPYPEMESLVERARGMIRSTSMQAEQQVSEDRAGATG